MWPPTVVFLLILGSPISSGIQNDKKEYYGLPGPGQEDYEDYYHLKEMFSANEDKMNVKQSKQPSGIGQKMENEKDVQDYIKTKSDTEPVPSQNCPAPPRLDSMYTNWQCTEAGGKSLLKKSMKSFSLDTGKTTWPIGTTCSLRLDSQCGEDGDWTDTKGDSLTSPAKDLPFPLPRLGGGDWTDTKGDILTSPAKDLPFPLRRLGGDGRPGILPISSDVSTRSGESSSSSELFPFSPEKVVECNGAVCISRVITTTEFECCVPEDHSPPLCSIFDMNIACDSPDWKLWMDAFCQTSCFCNQHPEAECCLTDCDRQRRLYPVAVLLSSTHDGSDPQECIDENYNNWCAAATGESSPWMAIKFEPKGYVRKVKLHTPEASVNLQVRVANSLPLSSFALTTVGQILGTYYGAGGTIEISSEETLIGQFVIIQTYENSPLKFSEVETYGLRKDTRSCVCEGGYSWLTDETRLTNRTSSPYMYYVDREASLSEATCTKSPDWKGAGYYRIPEKYELADVSPESGKCNTLNSGWIHQDQEGAEQIVALFVDEEDSYARTGVIDVLNCGDFHLYYLPEVDQDIKGRYCLMPAGGLPSTPAPTEAPTQATTPAPTTLDPTSCGDDWQCTNGDCIDHSWVCDGETDCSDGVDENGCTYSCENKWYCNNGPCIRYTWLCDGYDDCGDNSDEEGCNDPGNCDLKWMCDDNVECVPYYYLCDGGYADCADKSDEITPC